MNCYTLNQAINHWISVVGVKMDPNKIYDSLCCYIKEPVVLKLKDGLGNERYVIGQWINISEIKPEDNCILPGNKVAIQVLCEGNSWEEVVEKVVNILGISKKKLIADN